MPRRDRDFDSDDRRDDERPSRRFRDDDERPRPGKGGMPGWAWAMIVVGILLFLGGGFTVVAVAMWSQKESGTPKKTPEQLHKEWAGRSQYDFVREFGDADRNDFDSGGGTFYYQRGAVNAKTGKTTGIKVRIDGGQVTWVAEWE